MKMKTICSVAALILAAGLLALPAHSQETAKKDAAPKAAASPSQAVLEAWNDIGRKLIAMAEDFPEDKYDFKPMPVEQGFAQRMLHVANVTYFFTNLANGQKPPAEEDPSRAQYKTKADVAAFVRKAVADGAAAIKARGDKGMSELVTDPDANQQVRLGDLAYGLIEHSGEIYGQLAVYYRVAGLVPPESRPKK